MGPQYNNKNLDVSPYYITDEHYAEALKNGISEKSVRDRVRYSGWRIQRAITEPMHRQELSDEIKMKLVVIGVPELTYKRRVQYYGWSEQDATTIPIGGRRKCLLNSFK